MLLINLQAVHDQIKAKYIVNSLLAEDEKQAKDIEIFLNQINNSFQQSVRGQEIQNGFNSKIVEHLRQAHPRLKSLFNVKSGLDFERRMSELFVYITEEALKESGETSIETETLRKYIHVGGQTGTTFDMGELSGDLAQQILKQVGAKAQKKIKQGLGQQQYYLPWVQRKTDVQMVDLEISLTLGSETWRIYNLLKGATFSLKNYDSRLKEFAKDYFSKGVKLGGANYMRSIGATLKSLGYTTDEILNILNNTASKYNEDKELRKHYDHLAFIYELTGGGMQLKNKQLENVKFLICNDPGTGKISVRATRSLIKKMFDQNILLFEHIQGKKVYSIRRSHLFS